MRKRLCERVEGASLGDNRFGFVSAADMMKDPSSEPDRPPLADANKAPSKVWRSFFNSLDRNEAELMKINAQKYASQVSNINDNDNPQTSSSILERLMNSEDCASRAETPKFTEFSPIRRKENATSRSAIMDSDTCGLFTNRRYDPASNSIVKPLQTSTPRPTMQHSPPRFSGVRNLRVEQGQSRQRFGTTQPYRLDLSRARPQRGFGFIGHQFMRTVGSSAIHLPDHWESKDVRVYSVLYSVSSTRKHKVWENDGFIYFDYGRKQLCLTKSLEKSSIAQHPASETALRRMEEECEPGHQLFIGGYEVQIQDLVYPSETPVKQELDTVEKSRESPPHQSDDNNSQFIDQQMRDFIARAEDEAMEMFNFPSQVEGDLDEVGNSEETNNRGDGRISEEAGSRDGAETQPAENNQFKKEKIQSKPPETAAESVTAVVKQEVVEDD